MLQKYIIENEKYSVFKNGICIGVCFGLDFLTVIWFLKVTNIEIDYDFNVDERFINITRLEIL